MRRSADGFFTMTLVAGVGKFLTVAAFGAVRRLGSPYALQVAVVQRLVRLVSGATYSGVRLLCFYLPYLVELLFLLSLFFFDTIPFLGCFGSVMIVVKLVFTGYHHHHHHHHLPALFGLKLLVHSITKHSILSSNVSSTTTPASANNHH